MKYGAIDIGTNAARLLIGEVLHENGHTFVQKVSYTRIPLRLGLEVFDGGKISKEKTVDFVKTIQAFRLISEIFDVKELRACATSAMRDASNGEEVQKKILEETGIEIEIIGGDEEANLIFSTFYLMDLNKATPILVIDVGGGSTEISIFSNGEKNASRSFNIGTIRILKGKVSPLDWKDVSDWLALNINLNTNYEVYGTGGNINKIHKLVGHKNEEPLTIEELSNLNDSLTDLTVEQRCEKFQLKPDRADVIVPALDIYSFILNFLKIEKIQVPKIGLSDGIVYDLWKRDLEK